MKAVTSGLLEIVTKLIDSGADVNTANKVKYALQLQNKCMEVVLII